MLDDIQPTSLSIRRFGGGVGKEWGEKDFLYLLFSFASSFPSPLSVFVVFLHLTVALSRPGAHFFTPSMSLEDTLSHQMEPTDICA